MKVRSKILVKTSGSSRDLEMINIDELLKFKESFEEVDSINLKLKDYVKVYNYEFKQSLSANRTHLLKL